METLIIAAAAAVAAPRLLRAARYSPWNVRAAPVAGRENFLVHRAHGGGDEAARLLVALHLRAIALLRRLRRLYSSPAMNHNTERGRATRLLLANYSPDSYRESSPYNFLGDTSYTLRKGRTVGMCLRDGRGFHRLDDLTFVLFHELAHIATPGSLGGQPLPDHGRLFWRTFAFLLREAAAGGVLALTDYGARPLRYCGAINVTYNPALDPGLPPLR